MEFLTDSKRALAKAFGPMAIYVAVFAVLMPTTGNPDVTELALHQQVVSWSWFPVLAYTFWQAHRFQQSGAFDEWEEVNT